MDLQNEAEENQRHTIIKQTSNLNNCGKSGGTDTSLKKAITETVSVIAKITYYKYGYPRQP